MPLEIASSRSAPRARRQISGTVLQDARGLVKMLDGRARRREIGLGEVVIQAFEVAQPTLNEADSGRYMGRWQFRKHYSR